ncbi:unnamed protein product, partial [Mesorhabditis spiculigera]
LLNDAKNYSLNTGMDYLIVNYAWNCTATASPDGNWMGIHCGKPKLPHERKIKHRKAQITTGPYEQGIVVVHNQSHKTTLVSVSVIKFGAPVEEINSAIAGTGFTKDDEYEMYRYISTPNTLVHIEPGEKKELKPGLDSGYLTIFQKQERTHRLIRDGQEEDLWDHKMGPTIEVQNTEGQAVHIKIDVDEPSSVELPIRERQGPWFCTNWFHKIYYRKFVPPGYTFLHKQNMRWYLPHAKKKRRRLFVTVIKAEDDGTSTSRISRKELVLTNMDLLKKGGFVLTIDKKGRIIPESEGM